MHRALAVISPARLAASLSPRTPPALVPLIHPSHSLLVRTFQLRNPQGRTGVDFLTRLEGVETPRKIVRGVIWMVLAYQSRTVIVDKSDRRQPAGLFDVDKHRHSKWPIRAIDCTPVPQLCGVTETSVAVPASGVRRGTYKVSGFPELHTIRNFLPGDPSIRFGWNVCSIQLVTYVRGEQEFQVCMVASGLNIPVQEKQDRKSVV